MHKRTKRLIPIAIILIAFLLIISSCTHTATIRDQTGNRLELEVDSRERVSINGTKQAIYLAGEKRDNPILLWLDGGPGGSEMGWVRTYLGDLHRDFTIVCWDQRGVAASYAAAKNGMEVEHYVEDVIALSELLAERFDQEKIFLLGHSWGGFLGSLAAVERPDLFHAFIAASPHVNSTENDTIGYKMILEGAKQRGDSKTIKILEKIGLPPYEKIDKEGNLVGDGEAYYALLSRLYSYSPSAPSDQGFRSEKMFLAPEHSFFSKINLVRGVIRGTKTVYPKIRHRSLEEEANRFTIPLFVINAAYDMTCVSSITERWYESVEAPEKKMLYLENSGHNGIYTESDRFMQFMKNHVLEVSISK